MFFKLTEISDHPCCKMQEVVEQFFLNSIDETTFSTALFPSWIQSTLNSAVSTLKEDFRKVHELLHAQAVTSGMREGIYAIVRDSNSIQEICDGDFDIAEDAIDWLSPLGVAIGDLMERLYDSMDLVVFRRATISDSPRRELYKEFISKNKYVCPFCSIGKYKNRLGSVREGFDHLLNKAAYPLSSANMKNLIPTCGVCNEDYKKAKDILADGAVFYPYAEVPEVEVKVDCISYPSASRLDDRGTWEVNVALAVPNDEFDAKMATWERVYCVSERLRSEISEFFEEWMDEVAVGIDHTFDEDGLRSAVEQARDRARAAISRRMEPNQIIRAAFFDFLVTRADRSFLLSFRDLFNARLAA